MEVLSHFAIIICGKMCLNLRRQRRNKAKMSKTQVQLVSKRLDFKRKDENDEAALARAEAKKNLQQSKRKVLVIKHQATSRYDWTVQRQAGCKFWVHTPTGTISNEMPLCMTLDEDEDSLCTSDQEGQDGYSSPYKGMNANFIEEDSRDDEEGANTDEPPATGSLVYDSYEFNNFLNILDEMHTEEEAKKATTAKASRTKK